MEEKDKGIQYTTNQKLLFEMILKIGGSVAHNFVIVNLFGPVQNTTLRLFREIFSF